MADSLVKLLVKADRKPQQAPDDRSLLGDLFRMVSQEGWPAAALTRAHDADDAGDAVWLRADPAHFRVERANVRLLACGDIGQSIMETEALVAALAPVFGDEGFQLTAPHPQRWYLRAFAGNAASGLPELPAPAAAIGGDLFEMWPEDTTHRRWRRVFNETQILLAQHPFNRRRVERGQLAINGLWFWGAGRLPTAIESPISAVMTEDVLLSSLALAARARLVSTAGDAFGRDEEAILLDLRHVSAVEPWLSALLERWQRLSIRQIEWRTSESRWILKPSHRWRFWR